MSSFITGTNTRQYLHQGLLHCPTYVSSTVDTVKNRFKVTFQIKILNTADTDIAYMEDFSKFKSKKNGVTGETYKVSKIDIIEDVTDCMNRKYGKGMNKDGLHLLNRPISSGAMIMFNVTFVSKLLDTTTQGIVHLKNSDKDAVILPNIGVIEFNGHLVIRKTRSVTAIGLNNPWSFKFFEIDGAFKVAEYSKVAVESGGTSNYMHLPGPFSRKDVETFIHGYINGVVRTLTLSYFDNKITNCTGEFKSGDKLKIPASSYTSI